jgi:ABC-type sugar transport system ATPase subunit
MNFVEKVPGCVRGEILGVRPNDVALYPAPRIDTPAMSAKVEFVERLGFEAMVHLRIGEESVIARVEGATPATGSSVIAHFTKAYRFEKATGARVREGERN